MVVVEGVVLTSGPEKTKDKDQIKSLESQFVNKNVGIFSQLSNQFN